VFREILRSPAKARDDGSFSPGTQPSRSHRLPQRNLECDAQARASEVEVQIDT